MPLLIASTNEGKMREIRLLLAGLALPLTSLNDLPATHEPDETGATFPENARIKAHAYAAASGLMTLAEDSGLAIDALEGRPGVHSARYPGATYPDKFANLWRELFTHKRPWSCRYVSAVAVVSGSTGRVLFETVATVEGEIWPEARGSHGFGYDPVFYHPPYGRTFGEVGDEEKLAVAHRGQAIAVFRQWVERGGLKSDP